MSRSQVTFTLAFNGVATSPDALTVYTIDDVGAAPYGTGREKTLRWLARAKSKRTRDFGYPGEKPWEIDDLPSSQILTAKYQVRLLWGRP